MKSAKIPIILKLQNTSLSKNSLHISNLNTSASILENIEHQVSSWNFQVTFGWYSIYIYINIVEQQKYSKQL